jgi:hypothetical protein
MASIFDILGGEKETSRSIVGSLFGLPPELVAQQQAQQNLQGSQSTAMQYAQLDPMQRAQYAMFQGASGAASGLMGALGPESAAIQRAKQEAALKDAMSKNGVSLDSPQGFMAGAKLAMDMGMPEIAAKLGMAGAQLDKEMATAQKARFVDADKRADIGVYNQFLAQFGGDEAKAGAAFNEYKQRQALEQKIAGRSVTNVSVDMKQDTEFMKQLGQLQADRLKTAYNKAEEANTSLQSLSKLAELSNKPIISGSAASQRTDVANFLSTVGLASKQDALKLANSQEFDKEAKSLAITWAKKLGFNPSNADVQFIVAALPSAMTDPVARNNIINRMAKMNQDIIDETSRMESYAVKNKNLNGYKPVIQGYNPSTGFAGGVKGLSDEELAAAIAAKKGKK